MPFGRRREAAATRAAEAAEAARSAGVEAVAAVRETLDRVVAMYERLGELLEAHVDDDRSERRALVAAIENLTRALGPHGSALPSATTPRVIGGSFFGLGSNVLEIGATADGANAAPAVIDIRENGDGNGRDTLAVRPDRYVEVRCRFGDRWVDGFDVCEILADGDRLRYRLRRQADGSVLPTLFDADDVREVRGEKRAAGGGSPRRRWLYR